MTTLSIKWRISLWISAVLIAVITTLSIAAYIEFEESHLRNIDGTLNAIAYGIASSLDTTSETRREEISRITGTSDRNRPTLYRIWFDGALVDLLASDASESEYGRWLYTIPKKNKPSDEDYNFVNIGRSDNEYRAIWLRHKINGDIVNIVVAGYSHYTFHEMREFLRLLLILGASLIIGSFIATIWTVRCGLLPISITAKRLQGITHPDIKEVIFDDKKVPKELSPFVKALKDMLDRLNRVLQQQRQFISDAAHELRTPLSLAKSTLQAAQIQQRQPEEYRQAINDSLDDIARMEHLMERLLILARLDEVNKTTTKEEIQLDVLLRELAEIYGKRMECSGGQVILEETPDITILGNIDELIRLFSNILDNAVQYGPADGIIRISLVNESKDCAKVCIHDQGGNIPPESIPHLFERFYRVDSSRSKSTGGVGLGLAIAREIAYHHDGDISITSNPDTGTQVCIKLATVHQGRTSI
jgi:signal transduction histidine kinase